MKINKQEYSRLRPYILLACVGNLRKDVKISEIDNLADEIIGSIENWLRLIDGPEPKVKVVKEDFFHGFDPQEFVAEIFDGKIDGKYLLGVLDALVKLNLITPSLRSDLMGAYDEKTIIPD